MVVTDIVLEEDWRSKRMEFEDFSSPDNEGHC